MVENNKKSNNILEEFWKSRRDIIALLGFLTAIGAIFLTIPIPDKIEARNALLMVQFLWLIVISVSAIWLSLAFLLFSYRFESHLGNKLKLDLGNYISSTIIVFTTYLLLNLWEYMISIYKIEWTKFTSFLFLYVTPVYFLVYIQFVSKYYLSNSRLHFDLKSISLAIGIAFIPAFFESISKLNFEIWMIVGFYTKNLIILLILFIGVIVFKYFNNKN